jgi:tRNA threonylcarbamoyladenosine biosynthesis protein TsaB
MPTILAIETSTEVASVSLLRDLGVFSRESSGVQTHSQTVLPMVQALLQEAGLRLADVDAVAFGAGPGSFTGVRTACGIAQGLAFGADKPVIPVVTLMAMALACHEMSGADEIVPILDARMGEVYWAGYRLEGDAWSATAEPVLSTAHAVFPLKHAIACGNGVPMVRAALPDFGSLEQPGCMPHATQIARLAVGRFLADDMVPAAQAQPLYLRNKVAMTTEERLAKGRA